MSISLFSLLTIFFFSLIQNDKILACYYTNWAIYRKGNAKYDAKFMYPYLCTHIIYSFANIDAQNLVPVSNDRWSDFPDGLDNMRKVTSLKNFNPYLKVLLSVGGWHRLLNEFQTVSSTARNRKLFAQNTKRFLKKYNFDGFDIDWEYPNDKEKYTLLMKALNEEFKRGMPEPYLLTAAVSAGEAAISQDYDIPNVSKYLDYIFIMTYDFYGQFSSVVGHHTALYCLNDNDKSCADNAVKYWHKNGAPFSKLLIGVPTYGQGFQTNTKNPHVGDIVVSGTPPGNILRNRGILSYLEYCNEGYRNIWNETQKADHGVKDYYWLGYETPRSIHEKARYVKENGLAGMFVWTLDFDDFTGKECGNGNSPLIGAVNKELDIYPGINWETQFTPTLIPQKSTTTVFPKTTTQSNSNDDSIVDENNLCKRIGYAPLDVCTKFLNCVNIGKPGFVQKCPNDLIFDVNSNTCNWKNLVTCGGVKTTTHKTTQQKSTTNSEPTNTINFKFWLIFGFLAL